MIIKLTKRELKSLKEVFEWSIDARNGKFLYQPDHRIAPMSAMKSILEKINILKIKK
jgi:hypothetical protein